MKAAYYEHNGPARDVFQVGEVPDPVPGAGEVVVRLHASGVNPSDVKTRQGQPGRPMDGRRIPHNDGAGIIEAVGAGVDAAHLGARVWLHNTGFKNIVGTAAERVAVALENTAPLPDGVGFDAGACFGVPALTAYHAVTAAGAVDGTWLLIAGGAGAVGNLAVQIAKALGATVIATVSSADKAAAATAAGADHVIDYRTENVAERVRALTNGRGVDHAVEVNLSANADSLAEVLTSGGSVAIYGSDTSTVSLDARALRIRCVSLHFFNVYELPASILTRAKADINGLAETGALRPMIAARFSLDDIAAAHEAVESGRLIGNAVIEIG